MEMRMLENDLDKIATILLKGECDLYSAPKFRNAIVHQIGKGKRNLRIDFSEVSYLDSTGVGAIIQIMQAIKTVQGSVVFSGLFGAPKRVLELCNVISIMKIVDTGKLK